MIFAEHWDDYPPDDPPQGAWCSRCEHHAEDCECVDPDRAEFEAELRKEMDWEAKHTTSTVAKRKGGEP